jgi:hypothetical protein
MSGDFADELAEMLAAGPPCPVDPPCEHSALLHDRYSDADPRFICCADGCECRQNPEPDPATPSNGA